MRPSNSASLLLIGTLAASASATAQIVPVRELSAPEAKSTQHFGNIFGIRPLANGGVLVNDAVRRQLVTLDASFGNRTVVVDSVAEGGQSYGPRAAPFISYLGDSTLFVDGAASALLVIDPTGKIATVRSAPKPQDLGAMAGGTSGVDAQGNLLYRAPMMRRMPAPPPGGGPPVAPPAQDSATIVRASFETRSVDSVAKIKIASGSNISVLPDANGKMTMTTTINPLSTVDDWSVLSDGTLAFIRGQDYHIDWIRPDGSKFSSPKLPFDWKRLTDEDKQALIDSARTAQEKMIEAAKAAAANPGAAGASGARADGPPGAAMEVRMVMATGGPGGGASIGGGGGSTMTFSGSGAPGAMTFSGPGGAMQIAQKTEFVPLKDIPDYYPAIRPNAAKADLDGNLWILTTTSAQSQKGELIYDVINNKGELFQRVRMPVGRSIAGFGHKGVVYLMYRDGTNGWLLERTKVLNNNRAAEY